MPLSATILREQGRRVLHMVASAVFEGAVFEGVQGRQPWVGVRSDNQALKGRQIYSQPVGKDSQPRVRKSLKDRANMIPSQKKPAQTKIQSRREL